MSAKSVDMLRGGILRNMVIFALPLLASGVLQQSFNSIDVAVVGRWCSKQSLAAVGSNGMIISLIINLFIGISVGANVVIANAIGRADTDAVRRACRTAMAVALVSGFLVTAIGLAVTRPLLEAMDTPPDVIALSAQYLEIFFLGMPFMMVYNFGSAILRSKGDTRRPFYALLAGGLVNVVLNLCFVLLLHMDVAGVAWATVAANGVNAALILYFLRCEPDPYRFSWRTLAFSRRELGRELRIGVPAGVQGMLFSISNVFVQSAINRLGSDAVAGSAAAVNYEMYCYFLIVAVNQAVVAFMAQNYGAGEWRRCRRVFLIGMALAVGSSMAANLAIAALAPAFVGVFTHDAAVLEYGVMRVRHVLAFQFIACSYEVGGAAMRGLGYSLTPTVITVFGSCLLRIACIHVLIATGYTYLSLMHLYPLSWSVTGILALVAYYIIARRTLRPRTPRSPNNGDPGEGGAIVRDGGAKRDAPFAASPNNGDPRRGWGNSAGWWSEARRPLRGKPQ